MKKGSPLGIEPRTEEIQGRSGFSVTGQNTEGTTTAPKAVEPAKTVEPAVDPKAKSGTETSTGSTTTTSSTITRVNPTLPVALAKPLDTGAPLLKP